jgi:type 1 glutamine amidotransferase
MNSFTSSVSRFYCYSLFALFCLTLAFSAPAAEVKPLKVLFVTGGGYHDYKKLAPFLTTNLPQIVRATFDVKFGLDALRDPKFADAYDAVVYDMCDDEASDEVLENALQATRKGKPSVMIHCAVHAFRRSTKIREWETCCGMRSKVHDPYQAFAVKKLDESSPITRLFPNDWKTPGDELYQTIAIDPQSHQLLKAKSPKDGREHVVCWTYQYGQGRVFATTLGHDMKTVTSPDYLRLLANGLLWSCDKLEQNGEPKTGYAAP